MSEYRKKLIEVSLPLKAINAESAREKSIRHGHPSTLHLWWARRPLAACRAVLFASLVDDPDSDPQYIKANGKVNEEAAGTKRADLFNLIEELVIWENSNNPSVINSARAEIARCVASRLIETGKLEKTATVGKGITAWDLVTKCHCRPVDGTFDSKAGRVRFRLDTSKLPQSEVVNAFLQKYAPPAMDPFAGGGSIPLESQRLGLRAFGSDLNPVPVLINKSLIEIPPKFAGRSPVNPEWKRKSKHEQSATTWEGARGLAQDVRYYGRWMRDEAEKRIGHLYPKIEVTEEMARLRPDLEAYIGDHLTVIAWIWARTVASPNPATGGAHVPLTRSFWLSTKKGKEVWIDAEVDRTQNTYRFTVRVGKGEPPKGTIGRNADYCLISGSPIPRQYIRAEGCAHRLGKRLLAVVVEGKREKLFLSPPSDHEMIDAGKECSWKPETEIPAARYTTPVIYGMTSHCDLFTTRQTVALNTLSDLVRETHQQLIADSGGDCEYANGVATYLAFGVSKLADRGSTLSTWDSGYTKIRSTFGRQALSMTWDFTEGNPFCDSTGNWCDGLEWTAKSLEAWQHGVEGSVRQIDACSAIDEVQQPLVSTDPPYYDNVPYADLSDFFYIWLRRCLSFVYPELFTTVLVPKSLELVADPIRHGGKDGARAFFEDGMNRVFRRIREGCGTDYPTTIYYAFKQTEEDDESDEGSPDTTEARSSTGWQTFLQGLGAAGWQIVGTWPMRTELGNRMRGHDSNALASSVVLVCRPRDENAPLVNRKEFITALRRELPDALRSLQRGNIAPVDLAQAAIGPGMAAFTRYAKVLESDGLPMTVRTALGLINQSLDEVLAEQEGEFDGDTRWALSWFEQYGMDDGPFGDAETLSKAKNTAVNGLVEAGLIVARSGKVRLVRRDELAEDWSPTTDKRLTIWEATQHLIRVLDKSGEAGTAALAAELGSVGEVARDLAYRLYSTCERKKWAQEAMAYNSLVVAWPEILTLSRQAKPASSGQKQKEMFDE